jgi:hypothetical protein
MDRVAEILSLLFRRALNEQQDAPALTNIMIARASTRFGPRLGAEFSNGYSTWEQLSPGAFFSFCERFAVWDVETLRTVLFNEGQELYARLAQEQAQQRRCRSTHWPGRRGHGRIERFRYDERTPVLDEVPTPRENPRRPRSEQRNLRERWGEWWNSLCAARPRRILSYVPSREARERGVRLLKENLTPAQRDQYEKSGYFDVTGGETGTLYRIRHGSQMNVEQLDARGRRVCVLCFVPEGDLVLGDIMLAQKIALELLESDAIAVANKMPAGLRAIA